MVTPALSHGFASGPLIITEKEAFALGKRLLQDNLLTAFLTGAGLLVTGIFGWSRWPLGLLIGIVYSNAFEYFYHRFLLHHTEGTLSRNHGTHHDSFGQPHEPLHVSFGSSSTGVVILLVMNGLLFAGLDAFGAGIGAGAVISFVLYFAAFEDLHWRIHLGKLPPWLEWMRRHHFEHHKGRNGYYNVFLPLFDKLFRTT